MDIYGQIFTKHFKQNTIIGGLNRTGLYILGFSGTVLMLFIPVFSLWVYPISILSMEFGIFLLIIGLMTIFGFGHIILISPQSFRLYEFYWFIPVCKINGNINNIQIEHHIVEEMTNPDTIRIECQSDPWAELGCSDWVSVKKGKKEYHIGSGENYIQLFQVLKKEIVS